MIDDVFWNQIKAAWSFKTDEEVADPKKMFKSVKKDVSDRLDSLRL